MRAFKTEEQIAGMIRKIVSRADEGRTFDFIQEQVVKAEQRYSRVQELYLDGRIGREQYEKEPESYENGQKTVQPEKLRATIALLDQLRTELSRWDALSPIEKKRLLRAALEGAWVRENALVALQPTIAFLPILIGIGLSTCGESGVLFPVVFDDGIKPREGSFALFGIIFLQRILLESVNTPSAPSDKTLQPR